MKNRGLAFRLSVLLLSCAALIFLVLFGYNYLVSRRMIMRSAEENVLNLTMGTVNKIQISLASVETSCRNLVNMVENRQWTENSLFMLLSSFVESKPEIHGAAIAFEPYGFEPESRYFAPYVYRRPDGLLNVKRLGEKSYDYFHMDWYQIPRELERPIWSEPYYDEGGGEILMSTYSVPFYTTVDGRRRLAGMATADISLSWLADIVSSIKIYRSGYGFLITKNGTLLTHPDGRLIMNETLFSVAEAQSDPRLREIGRRMIGGQTGFVPFRGMTNGKEGWLAFAPLPLSDWSLGVFIPGDELMADLISLNRTVLVLGIVGIAVLLAVIVYLTGSITRPLRDLSEVTRDIAKGNLDISLPPFRHRDEVGALAEAFESMKTSLKDYIGRLTEATAARERIESELKIAREIQMSILPKIFPPFPDDPLLDLYAFIRPAREVGGDFYDFFHIDENRLCFVIGDVSGKGVPASLFMAVTKTLIKVTATPEHSPREILTRVNNELARDNDASMFVTIFLGILDKKTGLVHFANGGHNLPLIVPSNGDVRFVERTKGVVIGAMEDMAFAEGSFFLEPGDTIFLYTDGVTEAMNKREALFGDDRLREVAQTLRGGDTRTVIEGVGRDVERFTEGAEQSDDITMLAVRWRGPAQTTQGRTAVRPSLPFIEHVSVTTLPSSSIRTAIGLVSGGHGRASGGADLATRQVYSSYC